MNDYSNGYNKGELLFNDFEITNSLPKIKESEIKKRYQIIVDTPEKIAILKKMEDLIRIYDELRNDTLKIGVYVVPGFEDYFEQQQNGSLTINPTLFAFFNEPSSAEIKALSISPFMPATTISA